MELTEEQLEEIKKLAASCMKTHEICIIMQIKHAAFKEELENPNSPVFQAHQSGFLQTKYELQKKMIDLAKAGSSPAQAASIKLIQDKEIAEYE